MAFKVVVDLAQVEQLRLGEEADLGPGGVQHRRRVALQPQNKHTQSSIIKNQRAHFFVLFLIYVHSLINLELVIKQNHTLV